MSYCLGFYLGRKTKAIEKEVAAEHSVPTKEELRKTITGILKEVDFNTVCYAFPRILDICDLKHLAEYLMVEL